MSQPPWLVSPSMPLTPEEIQAGEASPIGLPYGLSPYPPGPPPAQGTPERLAWNAESSRRRGVNNIALAQLQAGAAQGWCEPCAKLQAKFDAEHKAQSEWLAANPHVARQVGMLAILPPPVACESCIPQSGDVPLLRPESPPSQAPPPPGRPPLAARMEEIPWVPVGIALVAGFLLARRI